MISQLIPKLIMAQDMADRDGTVQCVCRNELGGYNIVPADRAGSEGVVITVSRRIDTEQMTADQIEQLFGLVKNGFSPKESISAIYALGYHTGKRSALARVKNRVSGLLISINSMIEEMRHE